MVCYTIRTQLANSRLSREQTAESRDSLGSRWEIEILTKHVNQQLIRIPIDSIWQHASAGSAVIAGGNYKMELIIVI